MKFTLEIDTLHDSEGDVAKAIAFLESIGAEKEEPRKTRAAKSEEPKTEEPKPEEPKPEEPKPEEPKPEEPEEPEEPKPEEPSVDMTELRKKAVQILSTDSSILKGILAKYGVSAISGLPDEGKQEVLDVVI